MNHDMKMNPANFVPFYIFSIHCNKANSPLFPYFPNLFPDFICDIKYVVTAESTLMFFTESISYMYIFYLIHNYLNICSYF